MSDPEQIVKLLVSALIVAALIPAFMGISGPSGEVSFEPTLGNHTVDKTTREIPGSVNVEATTGNALYFDGSASVSSNAGSNMTNGSWTVCTLAQLDESADANATYSAFAHDNASVLIDYDHGKWAAYYDNGSADARATIDAPSPKDGLTPVCARYDESSEELVVSRDGQVSSPDVLDASPNTRNATFAWVGTLDEVRIIGEDVNNSTLTAYANDPVQPLSVNHLGRMMFDEGSGSTSTVYYDDGDANLYRTSWTGGVEGPNLKRGVDYQLFGDPFTVKVLSGSYLEGAPVVWVSWGSGLPLDIMDILGLLMALLLVVAFGNKIMEAM
ncbi:hypothetical protein C5B90_06435 [Haloferax sp. Atlit-12N]|uniref:hypothetical protein n=1 Tax=Haloferax sp. Atlit-12N TaxID=2077203 RepID=UPI000E265742|nr:hypothetical protein [Haloferax sp. Atlit-12N]RDZ65981.1 hypothetical protein C5B90_06435 [Haloferax sp. Atlit-12N]